MFGFGKKPKVHPALRPSVAQALTVSELGWQPNSVVEPRYVLQPEHQAEWDEFLRHCQNRFVWHGVREYQPQADEPAKAHVLAEDVSHYARLDDVLWLLVDRAWYGFPDPQQFALVRTEPSAESVVQFGNFARVPSHWRFD